MKRACHALCFRQSVSGTTTLGNVLHKIAFTLGGPRGDSHRSGPGARELPEAEAEAISVYLSFILSKVVNYNSVNTFWDHTRNKTTNAQTIMNFHRWYPTAVMMGDEPGRVLIASGDLSHLGCGTATRPRAMPMEYYSEAMGDFETISTPSDKFFRPTYPGLHLTPAGDVFFAPVGFNNNSESPLACAGNEQSAVFELGLGATGSWGPDLGPNDRTKGMSVLLLSDTVPYARVMTIGGGDASRSRRYQFIDVTSPSSAWGPELPLPLRSGQAQPTIRVHPNVVLLPDGTVFMCGGAAASEPCWIYDPATLSWSKADEMTYARRYHWARLPCPQFMTVLPGGIPHDR